ncbi:hypothetical protein [Brucella thiophenivorans]|uniref:Extracellular solute-binding domain protein n=1 Tax=Brucella thiophenivorans TaxID=571255 RepID=A0A256G3K9_9HYPH|nr:hypothetical protein [Brucella thiophenivorans]OYR21684.1 extracellular solute-binding domain protein [Brucella thiophenivorans]
MNRTDRVSRYDSICSISARMQRNHAGAVSHAVENHTEIRGATSLNAMLKRASAVPAHLALSIVVAQA